MEDNDMKKNIKVFRDSLIFLEKGFIKCPKAFCRISALSQISLEKYSDTWLFPSDSEVDGLILELDSGSQYVFFSQNKEILNQAYDYLYECMADGMQEGKWLIDFKAGVIKEALPEADIQPAEAVDEPAVPEIAPEILKLTETVPNSTIESEINKIIVYLNEQEEDKSKAMELILKISTARKSDNQVELLELYREFIGFSLIDICNELGLNHLIGEITARVFAE